MSEKKLVSNTRRLAETGILLAIAVVLSFVKLLDLPYGGSITACSMLPILIVAYRFGTVWGLFTGLVYGLLQMLLGLKNVMYFTTPLSIIAVILLDYLLAFGVIGMGGIWKKAVGKNQSLGMGLGMLTACLLRYVCHVISGCTIWAGLSIPTADAFVYSLAYNATYMLPETIVAILGAVYIGKYLNFSSADLKYLPTGEKKSTASVWMTVVAWAFALAALVWDVVLVFSKLQNPESGEFMITGLSNVNWMMFGIVTAAGAALWAVFFVVGKVLNKKKAA